MEYSWPGNVRELKSAFEYALVACRNSMIAPEDFPANITSGRPRGKSNNASATDVHLQDLNAIKKRRLIDALARSGGNQSEAARLLGISRTSVWGQIKRYHINLSEM